MHACNLETGRDGRWAAEKQPSEGVPSEAISPRHVCFTVKTLTSILPQVGETAYLHQSRISEWILLVGADCSYSSAMSYVSVRCFSIKFTSFVDQVPLLLSVFASLSFFLALVHHSCCLFFIILVAFFSSFLLALVHHSCCLFLPLFASSSSHLLPRFRSFSPRFRLVLPHLCWSHISSPLETRPCRVCSCFLRSARRTNLVLCHNTVGSVSDGYPAEHGNKSSASDNDLSDYRCNCVRLERVQQQSRVSVSPNAIRRASRPMYVQ
ncbi:uncharacterized protein YALI1_A06634g [Yarrowia lipolytica]|uniref:Uncharacterized protein n=1 Tax=Yarrowia lipolytica TaxID=4952 RepID=A0A1D8N3Z0_YARLL|nr:hypothetical protein YALI1_A06634g [Yarrowia lipolytica]